MDTNLPNNSLHQQLTDKGLKLSEIQFDSIINEIKKGIIEVENFLRIESGDKPEITFNNDTGIIGFSPKTDSINLRLDYLNLLTHSDEKIEYKDQLICFMPDKFYMVFKYLEWLHVFGIESAVHYYQFHNHQNLDVKFPEVFPQRFSPKSLLLSNLEIQARKTVDKILTENRQKPVWRELDHYLGTNFPNHYGKSIEELSNLEKPNIQITFQTENLLE